MHWQRIGQNHFKNYTQNRPSEANKWRRHIDLIENGYRKWPSESWPKRRNPYGNIKLRGNGPKSAVISWQSVGYRGMSYHTNTNHCSPLPVSMLRDSECYDPGLFMEESSSSTRKVHNHPSLTQVQQRFTYLANTTKNRHVMEAHALAENHVKPRNDKLVWFSLFRKPSGIEHWGKLCDKMNDSKCSKDLLGAESSRNNIIFPSNVAATQWCRWSKWRTLHFRYPKLTLHNVILYIN